MQNRRNTNDQNHEIKTEVKEECKGGACGETFQEGDENNYF